MCFSFYSYELHLHWMMVESVSAWSRKALPAKRTYPWLWRSGAHGDPTKVATSVARSWWCCNPPLSSLSFWNKVEKHLLENHANLYICKFNGFIFTVKSFPSKFQWFTSAEVPCFCAQSITLCLLGPRICSPCLGSKRLDIQSTGMTCRIGFTTSA